MLEVRSIISARGAFARRSAAFALVLALATVALPAPLRAAPPTLTGEAPVASQSDQDRGEAMRKALANVLADATGDPAAASRPAFASALAHADRYALEYRYRPNDAAGAPDAPKYVLVAEFDGSAIDALVAGAGAAPGGTAAALADDAPSEASVWISGVHSAGDYARVLAYLARSNLVRSAEPVEARGDGMLIKLSLATGLAHFLDAVAIEHTLGVVNAAPPVEGVDATLALGP